MSVDWNESPAARVRLPDLQGGVAVVTGASLGIGRASTELLLENGVRVFGISRKPTEAYHPNLVQIPCDLTAGEEIRKTFVEIARHTDRIDYIVNVAGIDPKYPIDEVTLPQWDQLLDLNLRAYYFVIKEAVPFLRRGAGKSIVNVSSINYRLGVPGRAAYSASKAGILGLTTGLSRELGAENIRVNTVSPGWIFTERQVEEYFQGDKAERHLAYLSDRQSLPLKLTATDIANHILFYLSQFSRASTAHNCVVDGGWLLE
jgi:NAD(P)-dependent dehydrogenase (short-subunit alcohol dehydrogenase family)